MIEEKAIPSGFRGRISLTLTSIPVATGIFPHGVYSHHRNSVAGRTTTCAMGTTVLVQLELNEIRTGFAVPCPTPYATRLSAAR